MPKGAGTGERERGAAKGWRISGDNRWRTHGLWVALLSGPANAHCQAHLKRLNRPCQSRVEEANDLRTVGCARGHSGTSVARQSLGVRSRLTVIDHSTVGPRLASFSGDKSLLPLELAYTPENPNEQGRPLRPLNHGRHLAREGTYMVAPGLRHPCTLLLVHHKPKLADR